MGMGGSIRAPPHARRPLLLRAAEFLFEFAEIHFDEGWAAMRAGVGHRTMAQVLHQIFEFLTLKRIVGFYRVPANCFRDGVFTQTRGVYPVASRFELVHQFQNKT